MFRDYYRKSVLTLICAVLCFSTGGCHWVGYLTGLPGREGTAYYDVSGRLLLPDEKTAAGNVRITAALGPRHQFVSHEHLLGILNRESVATTPDGIFHFAVYRRLTPSQCAPPKAKSLYLYVEQPGGWEVHEVDVSHMEQLRTERGRNVELPPVTIGNDRALTVLGGIGNLNQEVTVAASEPTGPNRPSAQEINALCKGLIIWRPAAKDPLDSDNPYRAPLASLGERVIPALLDTERTSSGAMNLNVVRLLGEIGSSKASAALLDEYAKHPSPPTAVSIGACMGEYDIEAIFARFADDERSLRKLLQHIGLRESQHQTISELRTGLSKRREEIREDCRRRSMPVLG